MTDLQGVWVNLVPLAVTAALTALGAFFLFLSRKVVTDGNASKVLLVVGRVWHLAGIVVQELNAQMKPALQAAAGDGKLTGVEIAALRTEALTRLKALAGEHGLRELQDTLKLAAPTLDAYLMGLIETKVVDAKVLPAGALSGPVLPAGVVTLANPT